MGNKKPLINKKDARHFQVVHRSMRDPKIYDEDASAFVLKPISDASTIPEHQNNVRTDHLSDTNDYSHDLVGHQTTAGTAALYGIYFDDREYDYLKHLKPLGNEPGSVFLTASSSKNLPPNRKHPAQFITDLPKEAQASLTELPFDPVAMTSADGNVGIGLHLSEDVREVLYALDDDAYLDDTDDRYFDNLAKAQLDQECLQLVNQAEIAKQQAETLPKVLDWTMAARIKDMQSNRYSDDDEEVENELDSVCDLPLLNLTKKKKKLNFRDAESIRSMTSSILSRTSHLELLDDQFDQMIMREYDDDDLGPGEQHILEDLSPEQAEHVDELLQEFLDKVHVTTHNTPQENLRVQGGGIGQYDTMRRMLRLDEFGDPLPRVNLAKYAYECIKPVDETTMPKPMIIEDKYVDRWDCESVLSTYSNTENRPQVISDCGQRRRSRCTAQFPSLIQSMLKQHDHLGKAQIRLSAHTGLLKKTGQDPVQEEEEDDKELVDVVNEGAARPKYEGAEEKRARKKLVKESRRERRMAKQEIKLAFKAEAEKQVHDSLMRKTHAKSILV